MSKITMQWDLSKDDSQEEVDDAMNGSKYKDMLDEMWQQLFRPRHKHGYADTGINDLVGLQVEEEQETEAQKACNALMDKLEVIYHDIMNGG